MGFFSVPKLEHVLHEAQQLLEKAKAKEAGDLLKKAQKKNVHHEDFHLLWEKVHRILGDQEKQMAALSSFIHEKESDVARHMQVVDHLSNEQQETLAQEFLNQAKRRFPMSGQPHLSQAKLYCKQGHFEKAAEALIHKQEYGKLDDQDISVVHQIRRGVGENPLEAAKKLFTIDQVREILRRYSYERFESLGENCEFGFIQRSHGREPLSLFRWGGMPREKMITLFEQKFHQFASPESSILKLKKPTLTSEGDDMEYFFHDTTYEFGAHTHIHRASEEFIKSEAEILEKIRPHFLMLARKLQEDLEDAEKIFLYKSDVILSIDECVQLHEAMCTLGNNKLLIIMNAEPHSPDAPKASQAPEMQIIKPNLIVGRVQSWYVWDQSLNKAELEQPWDSLIQKSYHHFVAHFPELNIA